MATKKSTSKKPAKKAAKKASKKPGIPTPPSITCVQRCVLNYRRCLSAGGNPIKCHIQLVQCIIGCTGIKLADLK